VVDITKFLNSTKISDGQRPDLVGSELNKTAPVAIPEWGDAVSKRPSWDVKEAYKLIMGGLGLFKPKKSLLLTHGILFQYSFHQTDGKFRHGTQLYFGMAMMVDSGRTPVL